MANSRLIPARWTRSFRLPWRFVSITAKGGACMGDKFWTPALDEVAGFGDDILQRFDELPDARFAVDDLRCRLEK